MADGVAYARARQSPDLISLNEAIKLLRAGNAENIVVDLGGGRRACADGPHGPAGLLQRLEGHRVLSALASGAAEFPKSKGKSECQVLPGVKEILDVVHRKV